MLIPFFSKRSFHSLKCPQHFLCKLSNAGPECKFQSDHANVASFSKDSALHQAEVPVSNLLYSTGRSLKNMVATLAVSKNVTELLINEK